MVESRPADAAEDRILLVLVGLAGLVAFAAAAWAIRPIEIGPVGFDTAASVLYARQIVSGTPLEVPVSTTPKPLLTLVDGLLYGLTGDWRAISWLAIGIDAVSVGLAALLAGRLAGPVAAGFVAGALIGLPALLVDAGRAYGLGWGLAFWAAAGLAVAGQRPRYGLAGLLLALGTGARLETVLIPGAALAVALPAAAVARLRTRRGGVLDAPAPSLRAALIVGLGGLLGLAGMGVHDVLLARDPLYWLSVPARATGSLEVAPPTHWLAVTARDVAGLGIAAPLAVVGLAAGAWRRRPAVLGGILALGLGSLALILGLAARGIWVSARYADPVLLAVLLLAGVGAAAFALRADRLAAPIRGRVDHLPAAVRVAAAFGLGGIVAVAGSPAFAPLDRPTRATIVRERAVAAHLDRAVPVIETALSELPGGRAPTRGSIADPIWDPVVLVTGPLLGPRTAVSLGLPASRVGVLGPRPPAGSLRAGQIVYHDRAAVADPSRYRWLELTIPAPLGGLWAEPLLADPSAGLWVLRLRAGPGD